MNLNYHFQLTIILFIILNFQTNNSYEYCKASVQKKICKDSRHIFCDNNAFIPGAAPSPGGTLVGFVPMTRKVIRLFLDNINMYRNKIASGKEISETAKAKFPAAARMRELIWDYQLAYMAMHQASLMRLGKPQCANSVRYRDAGVIMMSSCQEIKTPVLLFLNEVLTSWFEEKNTLDNIETELAHYTYNSKAKNLHAIINDLSSKVGCTIALAENSTSEGTILRYCSFLCCFFDRDLIINNPVYLSRTTSSKNDCSQWGSGKSKIYPNLCKNNGKDYPDIY